MEKKIKKPSFSGTENDTIKIKPDIIALSFVCRFNDVEVECKHCAYEVMCNKYKRSLRAYCPLPNFVQGKYERIV